MKHGGVYASLGIAFIGIVILASVSPTVQQTVQPISQLEGAKSILARSVPSGFVLYANTFPLWSLIYPQGWSLYNFTSHIDGTVMINKTGTKANIEVYYTDNATLAEVKATFDRSIPPGTPVLKNDTYTSSDGLTVSELELQNSYTQSGVAITTYTHAFFTTAFGYIYLTQYVETVTPLDQSSNNVVEAIFPTILFGG